MVTKSFLFFSFYFIELQIAMRSLYKNVLNFIQLSSINWHWNGKRQKIFFLCSWNFSKNQKSMYIRWWKVCTVMQIHFHDVQYINGGKKNFIFFRRDHWRQLKNDFNVSTNEWNRKYPSKFEWRYLSWLCDIFQIMRKLSHQQTFQYLIAFHFNYDKNK